MNDNLVTTDNVSWHVVEINRNHNHSLLSRAVSMVSVFVLRRHLSSLYCSFVLFE